MSPPPARQTTWPELLAHPDVVERAVRRGAVGLMAFHGGLEEGTLEIAEAVAEASGASLYTVDQPADLRWHVPSRAVDPAGAPALAAWLSHVNIAIAVHGYGRISRPRHVLVGGTNRALANLVAEHLRARLAGFEIIGEISAIPAELRGLHPKNPVNRPAAGGVQLELPLSARDTRRRPLGPAREPGDTAACVVEALVEAVRQWELQARPGGEVRPTPVQRRFTTRLVQQPDEPASLDRHAIREVRHVTLQDVIDDQFLARYRALLDAEDAAFDELEHAFEEGDRVHFDLDLAAWRQAVEKKLNYLHRLGVVLPPTLSC